MSAFQLKFDWKDFGEVEVDHPCVSLTFADLSIRVGDDIPTRVLDKRARTTRDYVIAPLYPLAEWVTANWWSIFFESEAPSRGTSSADYRNRHAIRNAREGYSLPDLNFYPEGTWTRIEWKLSNSGHQLVEFLTSGMDRVRTCELRQTLTDFVDSVAERLQQFGVSGTWMQNEWEAINQTDSEEAQFCVAAAWLGLDPYQIDDHAAADIVRLGDQLPLHLREEVFQAAAVSLLNSSVEWVKNGIDAISKFGPSSVKWNSIRQNIPHSPSTDFPWKVGYDLARELRRFVNVSDAVPLNLDALTDEQFLVLIAEKPPVASFDGIVGGTTAPCCYTAKKRDDARRFVCARGLADFLLAGSNVPTFLSSAETQRQQRSRAFAAELLAPASLIASRLTGDEVSGAELEDLAAEFMVSSLVIDHQVRNHKLANVAF